MNFFWTVFTATLRQRLRRVWSWLVLLLIPCLIIGIHLALPKDAVTAPVQVGVALPEEGGETLWALLEQRSGTVLTFIPADEDTIDRNIASGRWDCGVIVDEDFEALVQDLDTDRIFTLRLGEGSAVYPLVREALSACMASLVAEPIARDYLEDVGIPADADRLQQSLGNEERVNVSMHTADGRPLEAFQLGDQGIQTILYWIISAMILVWLLLAAHDLGRWGGSGAAKRLLPLRCASLLFGARMAADWLLITVPSLIAMMAVGGGMFGCIAVLGYSLFWGAAGLVAARLSPLWKNLPLLPPFAVALSILCSGALLDLGSLFPAAGNVISRMPAHMYLSVCEGALSCAGVLIAAAAVLIGSTILTDKIKKTAG